MSPEASIAHVAGVPPGVDFVRVLFERLTEMHEGLPPEELARTKILVPTRRMQRRLKRLYLEDGSFLLPSIGLVSEVGHMLQMPGTESPVSWLQRVLDVKALVARLAEVDDRIPDGSVIDLSNSLIALLDEMHGEGVPLDALESVAPDFESDHWKRSLEFLRAIRTYLQTLPANTLDGEALHRRNVDQLCKEWRASPPATRVVLAGSTGSRATTRMLMTAVARLPKGCVVLPGFDFHLPSDVWKSLTAGREFEDHPQFRFASLLNHLGLEPSQIAKWSAKHDERRNELISLSLRPAPVTDQWLSEGPLLGDLREATEKISLIEAASPKDEAEAIAFAIRIALEDRKKIAVIAPDATLSRRITAALTRWKIIPDDSGGVPLSLTAAGRFLRHVLQVMSRPKEPVELISLLKHPLTQAGDDRGTHMLATQEFEVHLRKNRIRTIEPNAVQEFGDMSDKWQAWSKWLVDCIETIERFNGSRISAHAAHHLTLAKMFSGDAGWSGALEADGGQELARLLGEFSAPDLTGPKVNDLEYRQLFEAALRSESVRETVASRPDVMIWGTLEARVQGADIVVLSGLNEGTWPKAQPQDPWLNRAMRQELGLLLPERQIGLAAHDFQQAISADNVILTRSIRADGAETVPSRWLSRFTNLLNGLEPSNGKIALAQMRKRGEQFLPERQVLAKGVKKVDAASRPAPAPPIDVRPRDFSVTEIQALIRDPYAIYARRILGLSKLDPLQADDGARQKGIVFHKVMELFLTPDTALHDNAATKERLRDIATSVMEDEKVDPVLRASWTAHIEQISGWIIETEQNRRVEWHQAGREITGKFPIPGTAFVLTGKADRIDSNAKGEFAILDYKTGGLPTKSAVEHYDQQLVIEALILNAGGFTEIPTGQVSELTHISLSRKPDKRSINARSDVDLVTKQAELVQLLQSYMVPEKGYMARRAREGQRFEGDYDHLSRLGEWDESADPKPEILK